MKVNRVVVSSLAVLALGSIPAVAMAATVPNSQVSVNKSGSPVSPSAKSSSSPIFNQQSLTVSPLATGQFYFPTDVPGPLVYLGRIGYTNGQVSIGVNNASGQYELSFDKIVNGTVVDTFGWIKPGGSYSATNDPGFLNDGAGTYDVYISPYGEPGWTCNYGAIYWN